MRLPRWSRSRRRSYVCACWLASIVACSSSSPSAGNGAGDGGGASGTERHDSPVNPFDAEVTASRVAIEIDYQKGAEPYTGAAGVFGDTWRIFRNNAGKLFEASQKTVEVPSTLDAMQRLDDVQGARFSSDAILAIADQHRDTKTEGDVLAYYVVWLDGTFEQDGAERKDVLGVSIGRTGVIAMFKPVIESAGLPLFPDLSRVVEQTVLVHEFGHAVGLVNNGIAMAQPHQDEAHGAHCSNERCVMYFAVEGMEAMRDYVQRNVTSSDVILFADECLADVTAAAR